MANHVLVNRCRSCFQPAMLMILLAQSVRAADAIGIEPGFIGDGSTVPAATSPGTDNLGLPAALNGDDRAPLRFESIWVPSRPFRSEDDELGYHAQRLRAGFPLRIYADGIWLLLGGVQRTEFDTEVRLPDSQLNFPNSLWNVDVGTMRIWNLQNGAQIGTMLRFGSASDRPFASIHEMTLTSLAFATVPYGPRDAWSYSLFYSPTSQMNFPIPGIAYVWRPSLNLQANLGIPASLDYRPTENRSLTLRYTPVTNLFIETRQFLTDTWSLFAQYEISNETYWLADRIAEDDRFFMFEQRVATGISQELGKGFRLDALAMYLFDRRFFQAESFSNDRHDVLELQSGVAGALRIIWRR